MALGSHGFVSEAPKQKTSTIFGISSKGDIISACTEVVALIKSSPMYIQNPAEGKLSHVQSQCLAQQPKLHFFLFVVQDD